MARDRAAQRVAMAAEKLRVRSALNPLLWLSAVVTAPGLPLLTFSDPFRVWVAAVVLLPPVTACVCYVILLFRDPDKLQSEEYQINKQLLEIAREKGVEPVTSPGPDVLTPNPDRPTLDDKQEDQ